MTIHQQSITTNDHLDISQLKASCDFQVVITDWIDDYASSTMIIRASSIVLIHNHDGMYRDSKPA